ncbi:hypothetical protein [Kineothrix sedimenti]|uniref:Uncharacterized protein n=1 Tax=Kineothrix sedimenti TaxID=3123317 RepID=A0ABZ3F038_9FIRM
MGRYMQNEFLDISVGAIVDEELLKYKDILKEEISKHYDNPYCSSTDIGKVIYKQEIMDIIDRIR